jgi:hypothetical protein
LKNIPESRQSAENKCRAFRFLDFFVTTDFKLILQRHMALLTDKNPAGIVFPHKSASSGSRRYTEDHGIFV